MKLSPILLALCLPLLACDQGVDGTFGADELGSGEDADVEAEDGATPVGDANDADASVACEPTQVRLVAADRTKVGAVTIETLDEGLWVEIESSGQWRLSEVQVFAGLGEPPNDGSSLVPEQFPYSQAVDHGKEAAFAIPFSALDGAVCGDDVLVVVHATADRIQGGEIIDEADAWGEGEAGVDDWGSEVDVRLCCE